MAYNKRLLFAPNVHKVDYLVVGGGGGAGADMGGGGGAGGFQSTPSGSALNPIVTTESSVYRNVTFTSSSLAYGGVQYIIEIGAGGVGSVAGDTSPTGDNGSASYLSSSNANNPLSAIAIGGGAGASDYATGNNATYNARTGGSGGGATGVGSPAGAGTDGQGFGGGSYGGNYYPASGGGAGGPGTNRPGDGGIGKRWDVVGQEYWWAGGGAGAGYNTRAGNGGKGGGGGGAPKVSGGGLGDTASWNDGSDGQVGALATTTNKQGGNGGANTGGGGGGGSHYNSNNNGGAGGSGVVILVFPKTAYSGITTGDPEIRSGSIVGGADLDHIALIFTQSGTYTTPLTGSIIY